MRRLTSLVDAGLAYLSLDRSASTLPGGEAQRVRLAAQLRSGLTRITCVLDEPTIGLHPRDTDRLPGLLRGLRHSGHTVLVVEHDLEVIAAADHLSEIGPGPDRDGGTAVATGTPQDLEQQPGSKTGRYLRAAREDSPGRSPRVLPPGITLRGVGVHNLRNLDVEISAGGLVAVTGVSGSGKSSLVLDVLAPPVSRAATHAGGGMAASVHCRECLIRAPFRRVVEEDAVGVVSSPWSIVATENRVFDLIRDRLAVTEEAALRHLRKAEFATTVAGGRCETCESLGEVRTSMDFLSDVRMTCDACGGARYGETVLACRING